MIDLTSEDRVVRGSGSSRPGPGTILGRNLVVVTTCLLDFDVNKDPILIWRSYVGILMSCETEYLYTRISV